MMVKNNSEIIAETDEDLQLQAGLQLSSAERQCLLQNGMLFMDLQSIWPAFVVTYKIRNQPNEFGHCLRSKMLPIISYHITSYQLPLTHKIRVNNSI